MKKEKTVRTYQRRTKSGKMITVREHKASYDAAEEARKAAAKKTGAGEELSKKKAVKEESPLGFSSDDYKEWYHWDMDSDPKNEAALRVEKALTKKMGKRAYNKYLEDMTNSYTARGHKKAHQALLDEHTASQKKQDAESVKAAKDIARGAKEKSPTSSNDKENRIRKYSDHVKHLLQLNKMGEKDPMMGSYIAEQKKILQDLKKHKGELMSPSEIGVATDSFAKKHKLSYEEDGIYSDKSGKTYRISTNPITGKSTLHHMVGSTIGDKNGEFVKSSSTKTSKSKSEKRSTKPTEKTASKTNGNSFGEKEYKGGGKAGQAALDKFLGTMKPNDKGQYYVSFGIKNVKSRGTKWMSRSDIEKYIRQFGGASFGSARITAAEPKKRSLSKEDSR